MKDGVTVRLLNDRCAYVEIISVWHDYFILNSLVFANCKNNGLLEKIISSTLWLVFISDNRCGEAEYQAI